MPANLQDSHSLLTKGHITSWSAQMTGNETPTPPTAHQDKIGHFQTKKSRAPTGQALFLQKNYCHICLSISVNSMQHSPLVTLPCTAASGCECAELFWLQLWFWCRTAEPNIAWRGTELNPLLTILKREASCALLFLQSKKVDEHMTETTKPTLAIQERSVCVSQASLHQMALGPTRRPAL